MSTASVADPGSHDGTIDLLIVGGGPAGLSAARAYREGGGSGRVLMVTAEAHPPYNRPPLSKDFLRGESEAHALPLQPDSWYAEHEIGLLRSDPVMALDPPARTIRTGQGRVISYHDVLLATGCAPVVPSFPGADGEGVAYLRSLQDGLALRGAAEQARTAVVVGSGFIGCEAAVSLALRGLRVDLVTNERVPQATRLGADAGERILGWLTDAGVRFHGGESIAAVTGARSGQVVWLESGDELPAELVLIAAGARPRSELAEAAGMAIRQGRVEVDARMSTATPHVHAAGDVAHARNGSAGRSLHVEHWGEATRMGEVAGTVLAGGDDQWAQVPGFWSEIGAHTLKYAAWGDGFDSQHLVDHGDGAFTVWYERDGKAVGVLTHRADQDYERAEHIIERGLPVPPG